MSAIPYTFERRPDTGVNNVKLGVWLFLASEVMFFGGLFSAYFMLRAGATSWPHGPDVLSLPLGSINTVVLLTASAVFTVAVRAAQAGRQERIRRLLAFSMLLCLAFLGIKSLEYAREIAAGLVPRTSTFFALYYTLTAVHALHVIAGIILSLWLWTTSPPAWRAAPARVVNRLEAAAMYWYFVDAIWLIIVLLMYVA
ncbi:MAG TPA: cytochrome c oxidase subunit 3 [Vicinamibacterales bacterium]|nr:cytochrome c oxidase subunit 3 [Vicinamibacterales bacterium]